MKIKTTQLAVFALCICCILSSCGNSTKDSSTSNNNDSKSEVSEINEEFSSVKEEEIAAASASESESTAEETPMAEYEPIDDIKNADLLSGYIQVCDDIFRIGGYLTVSDLIDQYGERWEIDTVNVKSHGFYDNINAVNKATGLKLQFYCGKSPDGFHEPIEKEVVLKVKPTGDTWNYTWMPTGLSALRFNEELSDYSRLKLDAFAALYESAGLIRNEKGFDPVSSILEINPNRNAGTYHLPESDYYEDFFAVFELSDVNLYGVKPIIAASVYVSKSSDDIRSYSYQNIYFRDENYDSAETVLVAPDAKLTEWD